MTWFKVLALLISTLSLGGCAQFIPGQTEGAAAVPPQVQQIKTAEQLQKAGKFSDAVEAYRRITHDLPNSDLAATAKYSIALIHVDVENPEKDYAQALVDFEEFIAQFPQHKRVNEAKSWRQVIKLALDAKKENERLSKNIERLKQLDVKQEEKRLGR